MSHRGERAGISRPISSRLGRYLAIVDRTSYARYLVARSVSIDRYEHLSLPEMWEAHERGLVEYRALMKGGSSPEPRERSLLDLKREIAMRLFTACSFCEHDCRVDRRKVRGRCGVGEPRIASQFIHLGEEELLVPSYTIFFSGCNLQCVFCQNYDISTHPDVGREIPVREMADRFEAVLERGGKNINWVGGDPTPGLHYVLDVLVHARANIAQVWNSNMYLSEKAMALLDGAIDIYLTDLKYGNDSCALRLSGIRDYMRIATRNHLLAGAQCEVIVRHLMLPGHLDCCTLPVLDWLAAKMPYALVNIMAQYHPEHRAVEFPELREGISRADYWTAIEHARRSGIEMI